MRISHRRPVRCASSRAGAEVNARLDVMGRGFLATIQGFLACQVLTGCIATIGSAPPAREEASNLATVLDWLGTQAEETCGADQVESVRVVFAKGPDGAAFLTESGFTCLD